MNFDFLKDTRELRYVYENCSNAEKLAKTMPVQSIFTSRKSAELLAKLIYMTAHKRQMEELTFADILADKTVRDFVRCRDVMNAFHFIRKNGNRAVHGDAQWNVEDALDVLAELHYVTGETARMLGLIQDYPQFDDNIGVYPNAEYTEDELISEKAYEMFAAYIEAYNITAERQKYEIPSTRELLDYTVSGNIEMHEKLAFDHAPHQKALLTYVQDYLLHLHRLSVEHSTNHFPQDFFFLQASLEIVGGDVYTTDKGEPFIQAVLNQLPNAEGFTIDIACRGNVREIFSFTATEGKEEHNLLKKDSPWTGAGMLDNMEYFKRRDRFEYKVAIFYPDSGEYLHQKILNGKYVDIEKSYSEEIIDTPLEGEWWSWDLCLWADIDFEKHPDVCTKLQHIVRKHIPKSEIEYCEAAWVENEPHILCNGIQWNTSDLREVQVFLDELNVILLSIKDDVDAGGSGMWEMKKEFAVASWDWSDDGFKIVGCRY